MRLLHVVCAASVAGAVACGGSQGAWRPEMLQDSSLAVYRWPPPPQEPRIALLAQWKLGEEAPRRGWGARVLDVIAGGEGHRADEGGGPRPAGIALGTDSSLLITDAMQGTATLYRPNQAPVPLAVRRGALLAPLGVAAAPGGGYLVSDVGTGRLYRYPGAGRWLEPFAADIEWVRPVGLAVDTARQRVVVVDTDAHRVRVVGLDGKLLLSIGERGTGQGQFNRPTFVAVGPGGEIVVADALNYRIQVFTPNGEFVRSFGSAGDATGYFAALKGLCLDRDRHVFVADARFSAVHVYSLAGQLLMAFGKYGNTPDAFALPTGVACDAAGRLFVADTWNGRVSVFRVWAPAEEATQ